MSSTAVKTEKLSAVAGIYQDGIFKPATKLPSIKIPKKAILVFLGEARGIEDELTASPPPTRDKRVIMREFKKTGKYGEQFLRDLEKGLSRSSYFK